MANLLSLSERYAYIRVSITRSDYERLRHRFAGESYALREVRLSFQSAMRSLMLDCAAAEFPRRTTGSVNASLDPAAVDVPASSNQADGSASTSGQDRSASDGYSRESNGW